MTSSQHAALTATPEPAPASRFNFNRWFTPTTIVVFIAAISTLLGHVMILGSLNQVYKQVNTLTDFTGSCVMNEYTNKKSANATPPAEPASAPAPVAAAPKPAVKPAPTPAAKPTSGGTTSSAPNNRLFDIGDIVNKK